MTRFMTAAAATLALTFAGTAFAGYGQSNRGALNAIKAHQRHVQVDQGYALTGETRTMHQVRTAVSEQHAHRAAFVRGGRSIR